MHIDGPIVVRLLLVRYLGAQGLVTGSRISVSDPARAGGKEQQSGQIPPAFLRSTPRRFRHALTNGLWLSSRRKTVLWFWVEESGLSPLSLVSIVSGMAIGWLLRRATISEDRRMRSLSIAPAPLASVPGRFYAISPHDWSTLEPVIIASLWYTHEIPSETMPGLAASLLKRGFDGPCLRRCAGEMRPVRADLDGFMDAMFIEAGVRAPIGEAQAREEIGLLLVRRISQGELNPFDGASRIATVFDWTSPSDSFLSPLVDLAYEDEYESEQKEAEIRRNIRDACAEILGTVDRSSELR